MISDEIKQKIWKIFDLLRNETIPSEHYHVILFLLSLYKDGIISIDSFSNHDDIHEDLFRSIKNSKSNQRYNPISQSFIPTLKRISSKGLNSIYEVLSSIDKNILKENFSEIFDNILYHISRSQGGFGGEYIQPLELTQFISQLVKLKGKSKVFNPFAGLASFGVFLDEGHEYFGQELNQNLWALGALRIMAYKRPGISRYMCDDTIANWPKDGEKYDLIVSHPPFGARLNRIYREQYPGFRTAEEFLLNVGIDSLSNSGRLLSVLPQGVLFRGGSEQRLRERLIKEDLIDTIISFPGGLLHYTGIPFIVLILNKVKESPGKIRLVKANDCISKVSTKEKIIDAEKLLQIYSQNENTDSVRIITNKDVIDNDFNLNIPRYFQEKIDGVKLKDLLTYYRGENKNIPENGELIRIRDLKDDKFDFKLNEGEIEQHPINPVNSHKIDTSCLLVAVRWKTLKPTYFHYDNQSLYKTNDILAFHIDETKVDIAYLINELHEDYVHKQIESFRVGGTIPYIRKSDLLEVKIKIPSLKIINTLEQQKLKVNSLSRIQNLEEEKNSELLRIQIQKQLQQKELELQRNEIEKLKEFEKTIERLKSERNALAHGNQVSKFNEFASLKHSLGTPRQNILSNVKSLIRFFESNNSLAFSEVKDLYNKRYETNLVSDLIQIKDDINHISIILEKGENGLALDDYELKPVSIEDIDKELKSARKARGNYKPQYKEPPKTEISGKAIKANITLFKVLLDNILSNADKYAFNSKKSTNQLIIELKATEDALEFEIRNNGIPFPKNFTKDKFITKFSTTSENNGSGLGGYDINRIAKYFKNPDWELILNNEDIYPVVFRFSFPIIPMINE